MPPVHMREVVVLATNVAALSQWYRDVLGFESVRTVSDGYEYALLESPDGARIGFADAAAMGVTPGDRASNPVLLQIAVPALPPFFEHVVERGGRVVAAPQQDRADGFWFGAIADPDGNPIWVVDESCP